MKLMELVRELTAADIRLWLADGQLRYSAPPGAMTAQRRDLITAHKTALMDFLGSAERRGIQPVTTEPPVLSFAQERLWNLEHFEGPSGLYNEGRALCIRGPLNRTALIAALDVMVQRHQVLRSAFPAVDGRPTLQVRDELKVHLCETDLSELPMDLAERQRQALDLLSAESQRPFDLAQAPLARFPLVRLAPEAHVLGVFMHHIICDGLSMAVVLAELSTAYAALCRGEPVRLPNLPVQYSDFAHWQRQHLDCFTLQRDLAYWRRALKGVQRMPLGHSEGDRRVNKGAVHRFALPCEVVQGVDRLARQHGVTSFTVFGAAYQLLLSACAKRNDVSFSMPVTERQRSELQGLIGLFVNSLVIRQDLADAQSFSSFLEQTRGTVNEAFAHQQAPYERVVDALAIDEGNRAEVAAALSQVRLVYLDGLAERLSFHDLQVSPVAVNRRLAKFDLMLTLERGDGQCACDFEYKTALFESGYIAQLATQFERLLRLLTTQPHRSLGELRLQIQDELNAWRAACNAQRQHQRRQSLRELRKRAVG